MCFWRKKKKVVAIKPPPVVSPPVVSPPPVVARKAPAGLWWYSAWANPAPEFGAVPNVMCRNPNPWRTIETDNRHMELGEYNEADPAVQAIQLGQVRHAGFDFVVYQIEHGHECTNLAKSVSGRLQLTDSLTMAHCARNHPVGSGVKFCVAWWDSSATANMWVNDSFWQELIANKWNADDVRNSQRIFARSIVPLMVHPDYLHFNGRPVFVRGHPQELQFYKDHFGIEPAEIVAIWKEEVRLATGKELHLVATAASEDIRPMLKSWGFTGLSEYLLHGVGWANTMSAYQYWRAKDLEQCRREGLQYWLPGTFGYDGRAENTAEAQAGVGHMPTMPQLTEHVREVRAATLDNFDATGGFHIWYAANEIREGGIGLPMARDGLQLHNGDEVLRAFAAGLL